MIIEWKQKENIIALRWFDNKSVCILSTYIGLFPLEEVKRWDRKKKDYIKVQMPHAIAEYNKFMRGVELCDMFLELYRIDFKSKKCFLLCTSSCDSQRLAAISSYAKQKKQIAYVTL